MSSGALDVVATAAPGIKDILVLGKVKQLERARRGRPDPARRARRRPRHHLPPVGARPARRRAGRPDQHPGPRRAGDAHRPRPLPGRARHAARGDPGQRAGRDRLQPRGPGGREPGPGRRQRPLPRPRRPRRRPGRGRGRRRGHPARRRGRRPGGPRPTFRADRMALQVEQVARLADQLPLPQIRLPFSSPPTSGPTELECWPTRLLAGSKPSRRSRDAPRRRPRCASWCEERRILVCCGSGGVGKTTTAAVLALEAARPGGKAVVVTIDPAKRLADALGLEGLTDTPEPDRGRLARRAVGADARHQEHLRRPRRRQRRVDPSRPQRILDNRFYRNISGALSGTQEYMAMEKLYELHDEHRLRPHRRRHPADPQRARLPRRAPPAHPLPRPPPVPHAHGARPRHRQGGQRRRPGLPPHGGQGRRRRGASTTPSRSSRPSTAWRRASGRGPPRCSSCSSDDDTAFVLVASPAARHRRGGRVLRRPSWPRPASGCRRSSSTACTRRSAPGLAEADAASGPRTLAGTDLGGLYANLADFQLVASREEEHLGGPGRGRAPGAGRPGAVPADRRARHRRPGRARAHLF